MKFLIVAPSWIGDMVMAQTLFKALKNRYGADTIIDVAAPKWALDICKRTSEVGEIIRLDIKHGEFGLKKRRDLGRELRSRRYDRAIVVPITFKSALIPFFARIPIRSGLLGEMRFGIINDIKKTRSKKPSMVEKYLALDDITEAPLFPSLLIDRHNRQRALRELDLDTTKPITALFVGAEYGEAKRWSYEKFGELANMLIADNRAVWIFGSSKDCERGAKIKAIAPKAIDLCGKTTIADAIDLISLAQTAVCNDSGLMHIAAAVNTPIVAIYGSSAPDYTPPLTDKKTIVSLNLPCSPCFKRICPFGHTNCLNNISAETVYQCI
ncbi:MAG: lipopolysaccharide heptosyltransferase II [Helicobacteraceae bacterium]|jgi:heptosyltransferase-2|nr:lipopolysaccharide heptosyltransferase II [Helicobacteraceae bacterium]